MVIELTEEPESALKMKADAQGVPPEKYVREVLEREMVKHVEAKSSTLPFKTSHGILAKWGPAPSAEDIAEIRADMFQNLEDLY